ncbi:MAG: N-acetyl-gamma-glutamyl-phosphate reductase [Methanomassiliicoccales archaeon PtaU1.Bin124]|nr:MAG: N-acetyl-gamma-glutamyl-phosphate reductase [Methanomassiliicoccales archaeon PtaU1.Bin124]
MKRVAIIGGSGYTGGELARLLSRHPDLNLVSMTSRQHAGSKVTTVHPFLQGFVDLNFEERVNSADCDVVFTATPHGASMDIVPELVESGIKVIDLSGDYRLKDPGTYKKWYGAEHKDLKNLEKAVYGIPELFRKDIKKANFISNPGCYPTCSILGLAPLVANDLVEPDIIVDGKSSTSGAGAELTKATHHPACGSSISPYKVGNHRHTPEIQMALEKVGKGKLDVVFTPHLLPVVRGMLCTSYVSLKTPMEKEEVQKTFAKFYQGERFIRMTAVPSMASVTGSNFIEIGAERAGRRTVVVMSAIDNLVKGASGQAIQNCNIMLGLEERTGLDFPGLGV